MVFGDRVPKKSGHPKADLIGKKGSLSREFPLFLLLLSAVRKMGRIFDVMFDFFREDDGKFYQLSEPTILRLDVSGRNG